MSIRLISNTTDKVLLIYSYMSHVVVPPRGSYQYNPYRCGGLLGRLALTVIRRRNRDTCQPGCADGRARPAVSATLKGYSVSHISF